MIHAPFDSTDSTEFVGPKAVSTANQKQQKWLEANLPAILDRLGQLIQDGGIFESRHVLSHCLTLGYHPQQSTHDLA